MDGLSNQMIATMTALILSSLSSEIIKLFRDFMIFVVEIFRGFLKRKKVCITITKTTSGSSTEKTCSERSTDYYYEEVLVYISEYIKTHPTKCRDFSTTLKWVNGSYRKSFNPLSEITIENLSFDFKNRFDIERKTSIYTILIYANKLKDIEEFLDKTDKFNETRRPKELHFFRENSTYVLNSKKSFSNTFFPEKIKLLRAIDNTNVADKKFGLLLYGLPGTGKTSIAKCISKYSNRHIISVNLGNIKNVDSLYEIFFGKTVNHINIPQTDRIYLFEDIDAMTDIVLKRTEKKENNENLELAKIGSEIKKDNDKKNLEDDKKLTLSDLLNVLDGIVELSGSIIIMTTNHIDKLDPALIRNGRITMKIELKNMSTECAMELINSVYENSNVKIKNEEISPASLQSLLDITTNLEELKEELRALKLM